MRHLVAVFGMLVGLTAVADTKEAHAGMPDMTKVGPAARKPTNERIAKNEIRDFFNKEEELCKTGDLEAMAARVDFPLYMATDDMKGIPEAKTYAKADYVAMMKPFMDTMKNAKMTHKPTVTVLSDSLAVVTDDFTMTMGKTKVSGRNGSFLVKVNGDWKWKAMVEAGWGGMQPTASAKTPAPAPSALVTK